MQYFVQLSVACKHTVYDIILYNVHVVCRHMFSVASPNNLQIGTQAFVSYGTPVL